jgi:RNA polymerase sigma factor (TIGR02999 family)
MDISVPDKDNGSRVEEPPREITNLLRAWSGGDHTALDQLTERVYPELRRMARGYMRNERHANTIQSTALVHEVYLRLVDVGTIEWRERAQFYAMAAQMMRRVLVDAARARGAHKRGGAAVTVNIDEVAVLSPVPDGSVLALDEASPRSRTWRRARPGWWSCAISAALRRPRLSPLSTSHRARSGATGILPRPGCRASCIDRMAPPCRP